MVALTFTHPTYLWILLLVPFIVLTHVFMLRHVKETAIKFSNFEALERVSKGEFFGKPYTGILHNKSIFLLLLRTVTYSVLVFAIAGTILEYQGNAPKSNFVIAIDSSLSMLAEDITPHRIDAAKAAAIDFVKSVPGQTLLGVVSFSGTPYEVLELTKDKNAIENAINSVEIQQMGGSNIGDSLVTAANIIRSEKNKNIILMTDGRANVGMDVEKAVEIMKKDGIVVDTIGIGTEAGGEFAGQDVVSRLDEETLKMVAEKTEGTYHRVRNPEDFKNAFSEIAKNSVRTIRFDLSWILLIAALALLSLEWVLVNTRYRTIP